MWWRMTWSGKMSLSVKTEDKPQDKEEPMDIKMKE